MYLAVVLLLSTCCHTRLYVLIAIEQVLPEMKISNAQALVCALLISPATRPAPVWQKRRIYHPSPFIPDLTGLY
jgi:hypothetical protein